MIMVIANILALSTGVDGEYDFNKKKENHTVGWLHMKIKDNIDRYSLFIFILNYSYINTSVSLLDLLDLDPVYFFYYYNI